MTGVGKRKMTDERRGAEHKRRERVMREEAEEMKQERVMREDEGERRRGKVLTDYVSAHSFTPSSFTSPF